MKTVEVNAERRERQRRISNITLRASLSRILSRLVTPNSAVSILAITALALDTQAYA